MKYNITGDNLQFVHLEFSPGEMAWAEAGAMIYMSGNVAMDAKARGGLLSGFKRVLTGESFFVTEFSAEGGAGGAAVAGRGPVFGHAPGDLMECERQPGQTLKVSSGHAVGWEGSVTYDIQTVGGIKTAFFGGEGLFGRRLTGPGEVLLQSMTLGKLATALVPFLPHQTSGRSSFTFRP